MPDHSATMYVGVRNPVRVSRTAPSPGLAAGIGIFLGTATIAGAADYEDCPIYPTTNRIGAATQVAGALGLGLAMAVLLVIYGHRKDRKALRERIILGLTIFSAVYSTMCIVPLQTFEPDCTTLMPTHPGAWLRIAWFASKYAIVSYEIFILSASTYLLKTGKTTLSRVSETVAHCACAAVFLIVLIPYGIKGARFDSELERAQSQLSTLETQQDPTASPDELDAARSRYAASDEDFGRLVSTMTRVWLGFFCTALGLWCYMRFVVLNRLEREWAEAFEAAGETSTDNVDWMRTAIGQEAQLTQKQKVLVPYRQAFIDVVRPLEPYAIVFLLFLPPVILLATTWCAEHSSPESVCAAPCELVLAFRSIGSSLVYLTQPDTKEQLRDWRTLLSKAAARFRHQTRCGRDRQPGDSANRVVFDESANLAFEDGSSCGEGIDYQLMDDVDNTGKKQVPQLSSDIPISDAAPSRQLVWLTALSLLLVAGMVVYIVLPNDQDTSGAFDNCPVYPLVTRIGISTTVVGVIGFSMAMSVILVIYAYRKDQGALRERIVLGLTISSAIYSAVCITPLQYYEPGCGALMPSSPSAWLRTAWFAAKFAVVGYEILILATSIYLLKTGRVQLSWCSEIAAHCSCIALFLVVLIPCGMIEQHWMDEDGADIDLVARLNTPIDSGLHAPTASPAELAAAKSAVHTVDENYQAVLELLTQVWLGLFLVALGLWLYMRFGVMRSFEREWDDSYASAAADWARDFWNEADRPVVALKKRLLALQKQAFTEVVAPLEPYVFVFLLFLPPAGLLATDWCTEHSSETQTCSAPCELALAFRSIGSSLVYLSSPGVFGQLSDWRRLLSKAAARLRGQMRCGGERRAGDSANRVLIVEDANEVRHFEVDAGTGNLDLHERRRSLFTAETAA